MIQIWFGILLNCCCCCSLRNMNIKVMPWQWQFRCHMARAFVEESIILFSGEEFLSVTNIFALFKCHTLDSWGTSVTSFFYCNIFNVAYNFHISSFWFIYMLKLTLRFIGCRTLCKCVCVPMCVVSVMTQIVSIVINAFQKFNTQIQKTVFFSIIVCNNHRKFYTKDNLISIIKRRNNKE